MILLWFSISCSEPQYPVADTNIETKDRTESELLINSQGDTIPTGIPIPVRGKRISLDSMVRPVKVPLIAQSMRPLPPPNTQKLMQSKHLDSSALSSLLIRKNRTKR